VQPSFGIDRTGDAVATNEDFAVGEMRTSWPGTGFPNEPCFDENG
jgi:hypothetical protein